MAYVGNQPAKGQFRKLTDISGSFNGVLTTFTTSVPPGTSEYYVTAGSASQLLVSLGGVIQQPDVDYTVSTNSITFTTAPAAGLDFFGVLMGDALNTGTPSDGSITTAKLAGGLSVGLAAGSNSAPSLFFTGDVNNGIYSPGTDQLAVTTNGVERVEFGASEVVFNDSGANYDFRIEGDTNSSLFFVDASADAVGIGTTSPVDKLHVSGGGFVVTGAYSAVTNNGGGLIGGFSGTSSTIYSLDPGVAWKALEIGSNTTTFNISGTERARIDSSGRLLVGTSSARASAGVTGQIQLEGTTYNNSSINLINNGNDNQPPYLIFGKQRSGSVGGATVVQSGDYLGRIDFAGGDGTDLASTGAWIGAIVDGTPGADDLPTRLVFSTTIDGGSSPTERMRIKNNGESWIVPTLYGLVVSTAASAGTTYTAYEALYGGGTVDTGTLAFRVFTNGNVQNTNNSYTAISDAKLKENIVDASSQWADIKALQVRNYNLKEGQTHRQIGLVAQEVEPISPGLVYESPDRDAEGNDLGTVTKSVNYSVLYMKAVKALQEAMERIETLEAKVAALEAA